jgi:NifU-like protein involved in Fe-S cluster formation
MNAPLYNTEILRLAASTAAFVRLESPQATVEKRSPVCGSRVTVEVSLDEEGRVADLGVEARACALGQASSALMAAGAKGRSAAELEAAREALSDYLAGNRSDPGSWPGLEIFAPALPHRARHAAVRLAFEAAAEAAAKAGGT